MELTWQSIITAGGVLSALLLLLTPITECTAGPCAKRSRTKN